MPELPDVEAFKRYMDATALHRVIERVQVNAQRILGGISARRLQANLVGHRFECTVRRGKHLLARLDDGPWLTLHFGMTGRLKYFKDMAKDPAHDRLLISFRNGYHLAYDCQRKLGRIGLTDDPETFIREKGLGPDALDLSRSDLNERLSQSRGAVKTALMNQKLIAGIGNIYSDEILFQAGIHPKTSARGLSESRIRRLHRSMRRVFRTAIDRQADPARLPRSFVIPHRGADNRCPRCGGDLGTIKLSGRTSYYCPRCQPFG